MKKLFLAIAFMSLGYISQAQIIPKLEGGIKVGANFSKLDTESPFNSVNKAGFLGGIWMRFGVMGLHVQPELYYSSKKTNVESISTKEINEVSFSSIDVPVLVGTKIGLAGVGVRFNTGPVISFIIDENQTFGQATANITKLDAKDQSFAWQLGTGADLKSLSVDLRYEMGLSKLNMAGYKGAKMKLFQLSVGYKF